MGLGDLKSKASEALSSDKAEQVSDQALDRAAKAAKKVTGGKFDEKRTYKVAVNSYVASVADYKRGDKDGTRLHVKSVDEIMKYLEQHPSIDYKGAVRRTYTGGEDMEK